MIDAQKRLGDSLDALPKPAAQPEKATPLDKCPGREEGTHWLTPGMRCKFCLVEMTGYATESNYLNPKPAAPAPEPAKKEWTTVNPAQSTGNGPVPPAKEPCDLCLGTRRFEFGNNGHYISEPCPKCAPSSQERPTYKTGKVCSCTNLPQGHDVGEHYERPSSQEKPKEGDHAE